MASTLFFTYFGRLQRGHKITKNFITFQIVDPEIYSILIFYKGSGTNFSSTFCVRYFKKNVSVIFMEYNCHIFLKYLVFPMIFVFQKNFVFQRKNLVFRSETFGF